MVIIEAPQGEVRRSAEEHLRTPVTVIKSNDGYVVLCHAEADGSIHIGPSVRHVAESGLARVVCCYPAAVTRANPRLANAVVGNWEGVTVVRNRISLGEIHISEEK